MRRKASVTSECYITMKIGLTAESELDTASLILRLYIIIECTDVAGIRFHTYACCENNMTRLVTTPSKMLQAHTNICLRVKCLSSFCGFKENS